VTRLHADDAALIERSWHEPEAFAGLTVREPMQHGRMGAPAHLPEPGKEPPVTDSSSDPGPRLTSTIDTTVPHSARIWNYWLGGKDNYAVDREAGPVHLHQ
jgi:hypothetical protein